MEGALKTSSQSDQENFVTVVSVGPEIKTDTKCDPFTLVDLNNSGYVTVLTIGDSDIVPNDIIEEVLVYRLPGERLGFGLKFEGGTKANEYVKRLFIQSCAPDSPASRVQSSWGKLVEGDEVLEIDSMPVNQMTRIDCVRCLKDSNVVIKLLIRHFLDKTINDIKTRSNEDLPLVVSAEKKRTPPPPPPVPPRKIPKKHPKHSTKDQQENPVPAIRHNIQQSQQQQQERKFQSPRSSGRSTQSPDVPRRSRRFSDGSLGPPDAEVYVDLFSQESTQNLSESDDTGSSISTVVDRFASYPTTTTSSLSGSLPSTPTSIQKHLDFTNFINNFDDDDKITVKQNVNINKNLDVNEKVVDNDKIYNDDSVPLQPPSCFQDAPLSYGNEDMRIIDNTADEMDVAFNKKTNKNIIEKKLYRKPPVLPRTVREQQTKLNNLKELHDENMNMPNLPRLVDFVPKPSLHHDIDIIQDFIENERLDTNYDNDKDVDIYNSKWSLSSQLATIGEVEEENNQELYRSLNSTTPVVIVENCDRSENGLNKQQINQNINGNMETPPSDSRQPPDGHEFPDYIETNAVSTNIKFNKINDKNNCVNHKDMNSNSNININNNNNNNNNNLQQNSSFNVPINKTLSKMNSVSNSDLTNKDNYELKYRNNDTKLHTRSQSLIDMSTITKKTDRWSQLAEQRRRGLSKLKGLVIPEHISEIEMSPTVNIPEIISNTTPIVPNTNNNNNNKKENQNLNNSLWSTSETEVVTLPLTTPPPWNNDNNLSNLPKYSPAFKRKSLQVYSTATTIMKKDDNELVKPQKTITTKTKLDEDLRFDNLSDCPKSLESITSPTRSDCSFDYITSTFKNRTNRTDIMDKIKEIPTIKSNKDLPNKSEDESDNDSAVSSSQSSYISRCSPPPSPTRNYELLDYENNKNKNEQLNDNIQCRLLKPASVEAINRKNILASAKCRSGRDLKVGSPIIQRKYDETDAEINEKNEPPPSDNLERKEDNQLNEIPKEKQDGLSKIQTITNPKTTNITVNCNNNSIEKSQEPIKLRTIKEQPRTVLKLDLSKSSILNRNKKSLSVTDLRKNFEKFNDTSPPIPRPLITSPLTPIRDVKSKDLKKIDDKHKNDNNSTANVQTKPIEKQENSQNTCRKIILCPKFFGGSLGITLAGGTDYETKEITIHKIRYGSVAYNDGQLKKGDKILSINGKSTVSLTHAEAVDMLKEPVDQFVLIVEDGKIDEKSIEEISTNRRSSRYDSSFDKSLGSISPSISTPNAFKSVTHAVTLIKDGAGLGFSIEGGKDSSEGDLPIRVKKIFQGGAAGKNGELHVGDEILMINDINIANLTKIEVWSLMKKLSNGNVTIHIHR